MHRSVYAPNGVIPGHERMIQSTPASPYDQRRLPTSSDVNGLAESLIGGVSHITNVDSE